MFAGWSTQVLRLAWPWRTFNDQDEEADEDDEWESPTTYVWVSDPFVDQAQLDDLLTAIIRNIGSVIITDTQLSWLYSPYAGGADVFTLTTWERDQLASDYKEWLPPFGTAARIGDV